MSNIVDYIRWRGDLGISARFPWNELDDLVMARFSYLPVEKLEERESWTVGEIMDKLVEMPASEYHFREDPSLAAALKECTRFRDLTVTDVMTFEEEGSEEQFAAMTIHLPNREMYLSFRGTDSTLVGWKEDFNMAFRMHIPAQKEGLNYAQLIGMKYPHEMIRMGGHSKGGNIAMYAAFYMPEKMKIRILEIDNYDGPGFMSEIIEENVTNAVLDRIRIYIPQASVVGRLLEMNVEPTVVFSEEKNFHQHNIYSWQVMKDRFIRAEKLTGGSDIMDDSLKAWLAKTSPEQRQVFVDSIYDVMSATNARTMREIAPGVLRNIPGIYRKFRSISEEDRKTMMEMIQLFARSYTGSFLSYRRAGAGQAPASDGEQTPADENMPAEGDQDIRPGSLTTDGQ